MLGSDGSALAEVLNELYAILTGQDQVEGLATSCTCRNAFQDNGTSGFLHPCHEVLNPFSRAAAISTIIVKSVR